MPRYDFECSKCNHTHEANISFSLREDYVKKNKCPKCSAKKLVQVILTAPAMDLPASMSFDGKKKFLGSGQTTYKEDKTARVPINIIDEKPGGGYTVTRIGSKKDIENE